uniref:Uncharacterized protein n=1 Tax=Arundo donax TaxID=35708 RepID=A0A0A8XVU8_ARUDO
MIQLIQLVQQAHGKKIVRLIHIRYPTCDKR